MSNQDPKFNFLDGRIYHAEDGSPIPTDEPVVVLRGKDEVSLIAVQAYIAVMESYPDSRLAREHAESMKERRAAFLQFQEEHPDRIGMGCHTCEHLSGKERLAGVRQYLRPWLTEEQLEESGAASHG